VKQLKLLLGCIIVGIVVALTYYLFESAVRHSIDFLWDTVFDSENKRLLVVPLSIVVGLLFFGLQHWLDRKSENTESHGLAADGIKPSLRMIAIILILGYFSLLAGASLGPEAVLVPACMVIGLYLGTKLIKQDEKAPKAMAAAAIMALMAAFFHSFIVGVLAIFLVKKEAKIEITLPLVVIAVLASASSFLTLNFIDPSHRYFTFPDFSWKVAAVDFLVGIVLVAAGYLATFSLKYVHHYIKMFRTMTKQIVWWRVALIAGSGLSILYLLGGTLVQFTGNESIGPMLARASTLGILGLVWIVIVKIIVIGWSKAMGYRGGLIFPMIFVASTLVAISQLLVKDVNFGVGLLFALAGILTAEKKAKILL